MNPLIPIVAIALVAILKFRAGTTGQASPLVYEKMGKEFSIPPTLLKTIVARESGGNPRATPNSGSDRSARGLMQITGVVRDEYNRQFGTRFSPDDLWDPVINVRIGTWLLASIVKAYRASGVPDLAPDWNNRNWIDLLILGYGAGYSASSGVIYLARKMYRANVPVTLDSILEWGPLIPGTYSEVYRPAKVAWCKKTAALYFNSRN